MSDYGRTWEEIRAIREQIKVLVPGCPTNTREEALRYAANRSAIVLVLLTEWEELEKKG